MITLRKNNDRGYFNHGWLETYHTFSFGDYFDADHIGFHTLRVINEDVIQPGQGFPLHGHRDMEIITYILEGELEHRDSLGNRATIRAGEFQRMSAGTGIRHSEFNASDKNRCHLLQIWIHPEKKDLEPGYEQKSFPENMHEKLQLVAAPASVAPEAQRQNLTLHQSAKLYVGNLSVKSEKTHYSPAAHSHVWVQMVRGKLILNGKNLEAGDGAAILDEPQLQFECISECEFLLFDLN